MGKRDSGYKPFILTNPQDVAQFIWYNSFRNGKAFNENGALGLSGNRSLVLSTTLNYANHLVLSINLHEINGYTYIYLNERERVYDITHSHPWPASDNGIGLSGDDLYFMSQHPSLEFKVIYNSIIYRAWSNGTYAPIGVVK